MEKNKVSPQHLILFGVAILAVGVTAGPYVVALTQRDEPAPGAGQQRGNGMGGQMLERMLQELQLTEAQKAQIKAIQESMRPRMQSIRDNTALSREQRMEQMRPLRTEMQDRIKPILTPEQQTKYAAMQAQMRARFGNRTRN